MYQMFGGEDLGLNDNLIFKIGVIYHVKQVACSGKKYAMLLQCVLNFSASLSLVAMTQTKVVFPT